MKSWKKTGTLLFCLLSPVSEREEPEGILWPCLRNDSWRPSPAYEFFFCAACIACSIISFRKNPIHPEKPMRKIRMPVWRISQDLYPMRHIFTNWRKNVHSKDTEGGALLESWNQASSVIEENDVLQVLSHSKKHPAGTWWDEAEAGRLHSGRGTAGYHSLPDAGSCWTAEGPQKNCRTNFRRPQMGMSRPVRIWEKSMTDIIMKEEWLQQNTAVRQNLLWGIFSRKVSPDMNWRSRYFLKSWKPDGRDCGNMSKKVRMKFT